MNSNKVVKIVSDELVITDRSNAEEELANKAANIQKSVVYLSALSVIEYEVLRKDEAKTLNLKLETLDALVKEAVQERIVQQVQCDEDESMFPAVMTWHDEIVLSLLLNEIEYIVHRYTVLDDEYAVAISLWVVFSWVHDKATVSPILNLTSPEKRCGKSTLLDVIESFVHRPLPSGNITTAAVFRSIEKWTPTLIIDEADTFLGSSDDMRGIINAGHYKSKAFVIRCDGEDNTPTRFTTWCAKVIAGIGDLAETIMDRSIIIVMKRKPPTQKVESIRHKDESAFEVLRQKLKRWSADNGDAFKACRPERVDGINDRANDNWEPLLAIASLAGEEWVEKARSAAKQISGLAEGTPSIGEQLLIDTLDVFGNITDDKLRTAELIDLLCQDDEKPWASWHRGQNITPYEFSQKLKPFGISSTDIRFTPGKKGTKKGYYQAAFAEAISLYAPVKSATEATEATIKGDADVIS